MKCQIIWENFVSWEESKNQVLDTKGFLLRSAKNIFQTFLELKPQYFRLLEACEANLHKYVINFFLFNFFDTELKNKPGFIWSWET